MSLSARNRPESAKERSARSQEQELKRARGAISCAECRRLKLKCDKTVPCSSCKRRGCASICPNGSLTTGQGTRFILADTDRLHRKIAEMSDRIRQLEDGLAILQSSVSRDTHPLLSVDLMRVKSGLELHSAAEAAAAEAARERDGEVEEEVGYVDAFGTLAVRDDGAATFYGRSAGSESLLLDGKLSLTLSTLSRSTIVAHHLDLHPEVNRLASTFPHGPPEIPIYDLQDIITGYLPPWPRAAQLRALYLEQAPWFFGAVTERQLFEEVFPAFYEEAAEEVRARAALGASTEAFNLPIPGKSTLASSHELALMLVVFCYGALTDPNLPAAPHNAEAERYYQLTRAALSLEPVMDRPPSIATVQVLSLMGIYQGMVADEHSIETTWALMGLASKLAQSTGLHLDCSRFKLSAAETQKRRALFWELFTTDCWQALATGRLPSFELPFVDTELPADPDETLADDGSPQPSFPAWKARWGKECVSGVVMGTLTAQPPKYSLILDLDRRIRDMPLPKYAQGPAPQGAGLAQTMSHYMPTNYLHLTLLYVHRVFFAHALMDHPTDPMRSQYAPSFLAGYRSASALLTSLREQFSIFPMQIARFWVLWTHAFSACVMLGSVVTRGGTTKTAQAALGELRVACDLFERASEHGGRAVKFMPMLRKLHEKAQTAYFQGLQPLRRDIFSARTADNDNDELSIFSGRTPRTVATKSNRPQRVTPSGSSGSAGVGSDTSSPSGSNGRDSQSPPADEAFPGLEASYRTAVHPELVAELQQFEGQLEEQINHSSAYYVNQEQQPPPPPPMYAEPPQQQHYVDHPHHPQRPQTESQSQQAQVPWYHVNEHQGYNTSTTSPPSNPPSQPPQQYPPPYVQYGPPHQPGYPQPQPMPESPQDAYHQQPTIAPHVHSQDYPPPQGPPTTNGGSGHTPALAHPYDVPLYAGVYSKNGSPQDEPYVISPVHARDYAASAYGHAHPGQPRSELWTVSVPPSEGDMSYPTSPVYDAPPSSRMEMEGQPPGVRMPYRHPSGHQSTSPPQPILPQGTGEGATQYVQGRQYAYDQQQQQQQQQQQRQMMMGVQAGTTGHTLQETWTTFFQQELPARR